MAPTDKPSTSAPKFDGVPISQLALVRVQAGLDGARSDGEGRLVLSRSGSGRADTMPTFHFALNGAVSNHTFGTFDFPIALIAPLQETCAISGQRPAGLDGADTYFHADVQREMTLASASIIAPEGTAIPTGFSGRVTFYDPGPDPGEMLQRRDAAIAEDLVRREMPLKVVAPAGWRDAQMSSMHEYGLVSQALGCPSLLRQLHMNAPDGSMSVHFGYFEEAKRSFTAGERLHTADDGSQHSLLDVCAERIASMRATLADLVFQTGCERAKAFYTPKIDKAEVTLERMRKVVQMEAVRADELVAREAGQPKEWYLGINGQPVGPMTVGEVREFANDTPISGSTPVWRAGMAAWGLASGAADLHLSMPHLAPPPPPRPTSKIQVGNAAAPSASLAPTLDKHSFDVEADAPVEISMRPSLSSRSGPGW